jgi:hypothetical protein
MAKPADNAAGTSVRDSIINDSAAVRLLLLRRLRLLLRHAVSAARCHCACCCAARCAFCCRVQPAVA